MIYTDLRKILYLNNINIITLKQAYTGCYKIPKKLGKGIKKI